MRTLGHYLKTMPVYEFERDVLQLCNPAHTRPERAIPAVLLLVRISVSTDNVAQRSLGLFNKWHQDVLFVLELDNEQASDVWLEVLQGHALGLHLQHKMFADI